MVATIPLELPTNIGANASYRSKELIKAFTVCDLNSGQFPIDLRIYASRSGDGASPTYANIWVYSRKLCTSGSGKATGYGYHKSSHAAGQAILDAGILLSESIHGAGDDAIRSALEAIFYAVYPEGKCSLFSVEA